MKKITLKLRKQKLQRILEHLKRSPHYHMISSLRIDRKITSPPPARNKP